MYTDIYELPKLKPDITFAKTIVATLTVLVFFALPAWYIDTFVHTGNSNQTVSIQGRVAGVSTSTIDNGLIEIPFINQTFDLNSQGGMFLLAGVIMLTLACILMMYVIVQKEKF